MKISDAGPLSALRAEASATEVEASVDAAVRDLGPSGARDELVRVLADRAPLLSHAECIAARLGTGDSAQSLKYAVRARMMQLTGSATELPSTQAAAAVMNAFAPFNLPPAEVRFGDAPVRQTKPVALVTGASRSNNIGFACARELGRRGFTVLLTGRDLQSTQAAAGRLEVEGLDVRAHTLDVTQYGRAISLAERVVEDFGRIDAVVNAAGSTRETLDSQSRQLDGFDFARDMAVNALGPFFLNQLFGGLMKERGRGEIVSFGTAMSDMAGFPGYGAAKAALRSLVVQQDAEFSPHGVRVRCFDPGWVRTGMGGPDAPMRPAQVAKEVADLVTQNWNPPEATLTSPGWEKHLRSNPPHT